MRIGDTIRKYKDEQDSIQKKTFTKWVNNHLRKHSTKMVVKDLYGDIKDGLMLIYLIEVLSSVELKKEKSARMQKIHFLSNIKMALGYLTDVKKIKLININPSDLVEGKSSIVLGLIWQIILYFQIQEHDFEKPGVSSSVPSASKPPERNVESAKSKLLSWVQVTVSESFHIRITDFTKSWQDGMAFFALIHTFKPDLVIDSELSKRSQKENLDEAFSLAEEHLGVAKLLDSEDILVEKPDEKSIMTYVSQFLELRIPQKSASAEVSEMEPIPLCLNDNNTKKRQFVKDVKDSAISKVKHVVEFTKTCRLLLALQRQLRDIADDLVVTDDSLVQEFQSAVMDVRRCQWLLDRSVTNEWTQLCQWITTSEQILYGLNLDLTTTIQDNVEKGFDELTRSFKEYEEHFQHSPTHEPIIKELNKLKLVSSNDKDFNLYTKDLETRILSIIDKEVLVRRKIITFKTVIFLKNTERITRTNLRLWRKELQSLDDAKSKLKSCQSSLESDNIMVNVSRSVETLSSFSNDDQKFTTWLSAFRTDWSDTEVELRSVYASLSTYIEQWNNMEKDMSDMEDWMNKNETVFIPQEEMEKGKKTMLSIERLVSFISEQSSTSLRKNLEEKLTKFRERFEKMKKTKMVNVEELRLEYNLIVTNIKRWLEKSEILVAFGIKCNVPDVTDHVRLLEEAGKSVLNVQEDFKTLSKIGQSISRQSPKSETDKMLGELKIQKVRLMNLMKEIPLSVEKMRMLLVPLDRFECVMNELEENIRRCENMLGEICSGSLEDEGEGTLSMYDTQVEMCLKESSDMQQSLDQTGSQCFEQMEQLLLAQDTASTKVSLEPLKERLVQMKETLKNLEFSTENVYKRVKESLRFLRLKEPMQCWLRDTDLFLDQIDEIDVNNVQEAVDNHIQERNDIEKIVIDLEKIQLSEHLLKGKSVSVLEEYKERMVKLNEASDRQQYKYLKNKLVNLIRTTEKELDDEEMKAKSAKMDVIEEIRSDHKRLFSKSDFGKLCEEFLREMDVMWNRLSSKELMKSDIEMLQQQCEEVERRIQRVSQDLASTLHRLHEKDRKCLNSMSGYQVSTVFIRPWTPVM